MNSIKPLGFLVLLLSLFSFVTPGYTHNKQIAITMDDLPFVGEKRNFHLEMIIETFKKNQVPVTGFIIANEVRPDNWATLQKFREAGLSLGNHTLFHTNLNQVTAEEYIEEIDEADKVLLPVLTEPKFFRYPYLAMGKGDKKNKVLNFLASKNYHVAPVTIDSKDFIFNQLLLAIPENNRRNFMESLVPCYLDFLWKQTQKAETQKPNQTQILLIHANLLNAYALPSIINFYQQQGYEFVSLEYALKSKQENVEWHAKNDRKIESFLAWD